ncbi:MAG: hypothetical protein H0U81_12225 [Pyrinomonadaceae bacterium]|nr:hypothetical protein [Pyrinomonadaceae bacterium]
MEQPTFFDHEGARGSAADAEGLVLHALGEFQARGKILAERELPLDRLRGALRRAAESFAVEELNDERAVAALGSLGAVVRRVPTFVAKHPFRVIVPSALAARALHHYEESLKP